MNFSIDSLSYFLKASVSSSSSASVLDSSVASKRLPRLPSTDSLALLLPSAASSGFLFLSSSSLAFLSFSSCFLLAFS